MELSGQPQPSSEHEVDHINGVRSDNRIENLRWVTRSRNLQNKEVPNETGYRWVMKHKNCSTYCYRFTLGRKQVSESGFRSAVEAHKAALDKRRDLGLSIDTRLSTVHP